MHSSYVLTVNSYPGNGLNCNRSNLPYLNSKLAALRLVQSVWEETSGQGQLREHMFSLISTCRYRLKLTSKFVNSRAELVDVASAVLVSYCAFSYSHSLLNSFAASFARNMAEPPTVIAMIQNGNMITP